MKKYFYMAVAIIAALSSCSSDDIIQNEGGQNDNGATTFTATIEGENTRATLAGMTPNWEAGDEISIDGHDYTASAAGATTTLTGTGAVETTHHAYFPASLYNGGNPTLPASYQYAEGKFNMPMYAESTTTSLSFKNLCGVLAITVPQSEMSSVQSIVVSSDQQMNGAISSITAAGVLTFASASPTDAEKKVTLTASPAVSIPTDGSKTFYVPVPAGTHNPLLITISDGTDTKAMITTKSGGVAVERSNIYPISFKENTNAWMNALSLGKSTATSIVIETVPTLPTAEDGTHKKLNDSGHVWEVLDGTTLRIQTSSPKIIGHDSFGGVGLFQGYSNVTSITGLENVDFSEVTDMSKMFKDCNVLSSLDLSSFNTSKVTDMSSMFNGCKALALTSLDLSSFNTSEVTNMSSMFNACNALNGIVLTSFNTSKVTDMSSMFNECNTLGSLDLSNFDTSEVTDMNRMFRLCGNLNSITLSTNFKTSKVENMTRMFANCTKLGSIDVSNFDTSKVKDMSFMFNACGALSSLNLLNFNTSEVTDMLQMFNACISLTSLDLSSFNTSKVTNMRGMFYGCTLTSLDLSSFNTSEVTTMFQMFYSCKNLESLTLSNNFVMTKVSDKGQMFNLCGTSAPGSKCTVYGASSDTKYAFTQSGTNWSNGYMQFAPPY